MPFEGELKEKVIEILTKQKNDLEKRDKVDRERERLDRDLRELRPKRIQPIAPVASSGGNLADSEKIKQVMSVLKQL